MAGESLCPAVRAVCASSVRPRGPVRGANGTQHISCVAITRPGSRMNPRLDGVRQAKTADLDPRLPVVIPYQERQ